MTVATTTRTNTRTRRRAFSLIELMLVLVILGVLGTVAAIAIIPQGERAKFKATKLTLETIGSNIEAYQLEEGSLPPTLNALVTAGYLKAGRLNDAWSNPLFYRPNALMGHPFQLVSQGKDAADKSDDINYWTMNE